MERGVEAPIVLAGYAHFSRAYPFSFKENILCFCSWILSCRDLCFVMRSWVHAVRCYPRRPVSPPPPCRTISCVKNRLDTMIYTRIPPKEHHSTVTLLCVLPERARFTTTLLYLRRPFMRQLGRLHAYN